MIKSTLPYSINFILLNQLTEKVCKFNTYTYGLILESFLDKCYLTKQLRKLLGKYIVRMTKRRILKKNYSVYKYKIYIRFKN